MPCDYDFLLFSFFLRVWGGLLLFLGGGYFGFGFAFSVSVCFVFLCWGVLLSIFLSFFLFIPLYPLLPSFLFSTLSYFPSTRLPSSPSHATLCSLYSFHPPPSPSQAYLHKRHRLSRYCNVGTYNLFMDGDGEVLGLFADRRARGER